MSRPAIQLPGGRLTQNGLFYGAARQYQEGRTREPEVVKVYEKIKAGTWVFNGYFRLTDAWQEESNQRKVYKFKLELIANWDPETGQSADLDALRVIPSWVKSTVWQREQGRCWICGSEDGLRYVPVIANSEVETFYGPDNIQLRCQRHW